MENTMNELNNSIKSFKSRLDHAVVRISDLEYSTFLKKKRRMKNLEENLKNIMGDNQRK